LENINLKALIRLVGINENTLRAWERRYKAVEPIRDELGRRLYSARDVERVKLLWALVKEGHNISRIAELPAPALKKLLKSSLAPEAPAMSATSSKTEAFLNDIIKALEKFQLERLNLTLQRARFELSSKEIIVNLVRPLLVRVGQLIFEGKLSITQEHILSALLRDYLGMLFQSLSPYDYSSRPHSKTVLLTTREGDIHEFGILLAAILCNLYRLRTYYLGPNMPLEDLIEASTQLKADYIIMGLMTLPKKREIITAQEYVTQLDQRLPRKITFCLGGSVTSQHFKSLSDRQVLMFGALEELDKFLASL
jgi:MerR family transcriptional regulator, light-induced transcriptional regulator